MKCSYTNSEWIVDVIIIVTLTNKRTKRCSINAHKMGGMCAEHKDKLYLMNFPNEHTLPTLLATIAIAILLKMRF